MFVIDGPQTAFYRQHHERSFFSAKYQVISLYRSKKSARECRGGGVRGAVGPDGRNEASEQL